MGEKDLSEKILADYNDVFADIFNVLVLKGKNKIIPEELCSTSVLSQYKADDGILHEQERDVSKYWEKQKITLALFGIENQTVADKNMPFRRTLYHLVSSGNLSVAVASKEMRQTEEDFLTSMKKEGYTVPCVDDE